jgi:hypothetical protein
MANQVDRVGNFITIKEIDSDWDHTVLFPNYNEIRLQAIRFHPGAVDDVCIIKEGSDGANAPRTFEYTASEDTLPAIEYYGGVGSKPVLDFSAGTYSSGSSVTIIINPH